MKITLTADSANESPLVLKIHSLDGDRRKARVFLQPGQSASFDILSLDELTRTSVEVRGTPSTNTSKLEVVPPVEAVSGIETPLESIAESKPPAKPIKKDQSRKARH